MYHLLIKKFSSYIVCWLDILDMACLTRNTTTYLYVFAFFVGERNKCEYTLILKREMENQIWSRESSARNIPDTHVNKKCQPGCNQEKSVLSFFSSSRNICILCLFSMWTKFICTGNRMTFQRKEEGDFLTRAKCLNVTKKMQKNETDSRIALNLNISLHRIYIKQDLHHSQISCPLKQEVTDLYHTHILCP